MQKSKVLNVIPCVFAVLVLISLSACSMEKQGYVSQENAVPLENEQEMMEDNLAKNMIVSGTVAEVIKEGDTYRIFIENDDMGMVFYAKEDVFVIDGEDKSFLSLADMEEDMQITAVYDKMTPMTLSLPPQTSGAIGFVVNGGAGSVVLSVFDDMLVNFEDTLKLNLGNRTNIVDIKETTEMLTAEDVKGSEALVFYTFSTRSIPAQTTPGLIVIVNSKEEFGVETE